MEVQAMPNHDLRFVASRIPRDIRDLLGEHSGRLFVAGGFIRATIAGETPADIDLFGDDKDHLELVATILKGRRDGATLHKTNNAITLLTPGRMTVQFITRWTFRAAELLLPSFDFTVCQAAVWRHTYGKHGQWSGLVGDRFYQDLAARRLVYTAPIREEEPGGSLMRVLKFTKRGYSVQVTSLGAVVARLMSGVRDDGREMTEQRRSYVLGGLLRKVDPSLAIDGFEVVEDGAPQDGFDDPPDDEITF